MHVGRYVRPQAAEKDIAKFGGLVDGETVWFFGHANSSTPMISRLVITNARVMGLSIGSGYTYKAPITQVTSTVYQEGLLQVTTTDGRVVTFKGIHADDMPPIQHHLEYARNHAPPAHVLDALTEQGASGSSVLTISGETHEDYKYADRSQWAAKDAADKSQWAAKDAADKSQWPAKDAADRRKTGQELASEIFAGNKVTIYRNGCVQINWGRYERLISIEATSDVSKKRVIGRAAAAVITIGVSLVSANRRGDVYLTIVTDCKAHVLHADTPTARNLTASKKLEAAGNAAIRISAALDEATSTRPGEGVRDAEAERMTVQGSPSGGGAGGETMSDRLRELSAMRDEGLVSSEEFEAIRAKVLDSL